MENERTIEEILDTLEKGEEFDCTEIEYSDMDQYHDETYMCGGYKPWK